MHHVGFNPFSSVGVKRVSMSTLSRSQYHWSVSDSALVFRHSIRNFRSIAFTFWRQLHFLCYLTYTNSAFTASEVQQCEAFEFRADSGDFLEKTGETFPMCPFIHSFRSFITTSTAVGRKGCWNQSRQFYEESKVTSWKNHHYITGFHIRSKNIQSRMNSPSPKSPHTQSGPTQTK